MRFDWLLSMWQYKNELARLKELNTYCILDTPAESDFDEITQLLSNILEVPIATITLIDKDREWFKSAVGLHEIENVRKFAFCAHTIYANELFVVSDASIDPAFATNPMVIGKPHIRFYAGVPLLSPSGYAIGALAIKDYKRRELSSAQVTTLKVIARQVMVQLELRKQNRQIGQLSEQKSLINKKLSLQTQRLQKEKEFLKALLESLTEGIVACDSKGKLSLFNHATKVLHGLGQERLSANKWAEHYDLFMPDGKTPVPLNKIPLLRAYRGEKVINEELTIVPKNRPAKTIICNGQPILKSDGTKLGAVIAMRDISTQRAKDSELEKSEAKLSAIFNQSSLFQGLMDADGTVLDINESALNSCGYNRDIEIGKKFWDTSWWNQDPKISNYIHEVVKKGQKGEIVHAATFYHLANGERRQTEFILTPILDDTKKVEYLLASGQDVTERKKSELELESANRTLRLLSSIKELLTQNITESDFLEKISELIVNLGGYGLAWVGYCDESKKSIKPVSYCGNGATWLADKVLCVDSFNSYDKAPACEVIKTGLQLILRDINNHSQFEFWTSKVSEYRYQDLIVVPLSHNNSIFGLLEIYTKPCIDLSDSEIDLIHELASSVALGIMSIRSHEESQRTHTALYKMATSVSALAEEEFFLNLTRNMTDALGVNGAFISMITSFKPLKAKTLAAIVDGKPIENIEYYVGQDPCHHLLNVETFVSQQSEGFQPSSLMVKLGMENYIGQRLLNRHGDPIGMLFVLMREKLKDLEVITSLLKIFATRAGAELERLEANKRIREQASLLDKAQDAILVRDMNNVVQFWNSGAERLYGWTREEAIGSFIEDLIYPDPSDFNVAMRELLETGEWNGEIEQKNKSHENLIIESHWTLMKDDNGQPQSVFTINTNVTDRKTAADKIEHLAYYDALTNLPNRALLIDRLKQALISCSRSNCYGALLFIDIDNFKVLNDTLGHDIGDLLLTEIAKRLKTCVREMDNVARFGGDEFVVMLENLSSLESEAAFITTKITEKILDSLKLHYNLGEHEYKSTASIGITLFLDPEMSVKELLKRADLAMYQAKTIGRNTYSFFDPKMESEMAARVSLESDLRLSIDKQQLSLHYQPQIGSDGLVIGAEALLRWHHPERGFVTPALFIPIAEDTRLILPIGLWVLETACAQLACWNNTPVFSNLTLAVNVSVYQFRQTDFVDQVINVVDKSGINPTKLKLELTESLFADNTDDIIKKMYQLKAKGIGFSLDDFGTGYSSLSYLKKMPLNQLKIDQSFVRDILDDPNDASIAQMIIGLARSLSLEVIAEGVESEEQKQYLFEMGCKLYQGFFFSKPLSINEFERFVIN